jgi:hypothetical protein
MHEYLLAPFQDVVAHVGGERMLAASIVALSMLLGSSSIGGALYVLLRPKRDAAQQD